jgi:hypothetical protein
MGANNAAEQKSQGVGHVYVSAASRTGVVQRKGTSVFSKRGARTRSTALGCCNCKTIYRS